MPLPAPIRLLIALVAILATAPLLRRSISGWMRVA